MKKLISQILIIAIVLGTVGIIPSLAEDYTGHAQEDAISFVVTNGYWTADGDFGPDQAATRAQTASVFARYLSNLRPTYAGNYSDVNASHAYANDITLATNLGLVSGSSGNFRPDAAITREEFAVMLVRAYEIAGLEVDDTKYATKRIKDYDSISDWAKASVTDALGNGYMLSGQKKMFNPASTVSRAEVAAATYSLYYATEPFRTTDYTVRDVTSSDNIEGDFDVLYNTSLYDCVGLSGVGVIARFDGAPGEIYVKREKGEYDTRYGNMTAPVSFVRIVGPDGFVICRVDLDWLTTGTMEKIINIPSGPAGIYQIQVINGIHNDPISIGIKNPVSWGIRAEDNISFVGNAPKTGYIYVPNKLEWLSIGINGENGSTIKLYSADGSNLIAESNPGAGAETRITFSDNPEIAENRGKKLSRSLISTNTVYKYEISNGFTGILGITGMTPVIYETAEDALDLKSGYINYSDSYGPYKDGENNDDATLQLTGPLQQRARERMIEIYEEMGGDFTVDVSEFKSTLSTSLADSVENPLAEAQLFNSSTSSIKNITGLIDTQCVDPSNPWFGSAIWRTKNADGSYVNSWTGELQETDYSYPDWQTGDYVVEPNEHAFTGGLTINSELNAYYNNPVLAKRAELMLLHLITQMPADGLMTHEITESEAAYEYLRQYENFFYGEHAFAQGYYYVRNFLSPETRAITDEGVLLNADKMMNLRGQGPTNQLLMGMNGNIYTYAWSGEERYHENAKRQIMGMIHPTTKPNYHGQSPLGYFIESYGADGQSYARMNEGLWSAMLRMYLNLPESKQDPELKAAMIAAENLYLKWDSYFYTPSTENFNAYSPTNWTSRTNAGLGGVQVPGSVYLVNYFPAAKKTWLVRLIGDNYKDYENFNKTIVSIGFTSTRLHNNNVAKNWIKSYMGSNYDSYASASNPESYTATNSEMYYVWHEDQQFNDSEMPLLPYELEGDGNIILNENGIVGVKHQGLYIFSYFNTGITKNGQSNIAWMGGGPTTIWDDYFASTIHPRKVGTHSPFTVIKPNGSTVEYTADEAYQAFKLDTSYTTTDYRRVFMTKDSGGNILQQYQITPDDIMHSAIVGTDASGNLIASGREDAAFSWITQNESFRISGLDSTSGKTIIWDYYLEDDGILIDAGVSEVAEGEELYVQLPILVQSGAAYTFDETNKRITLEHNGNKIVYQFASDTIVLGSKSTSNATGANYKYIRLKLTTAAPKTTIKITRTLAS